MADYVVEQQGWSDEYNNSSLSQSEYVRNKQEVALVLNFLENVQDLANRQDISEEERHSRRKRLEKDVAEGVVGGGILGYAGYHHHEKKEEKAEKKAEKKEEEEATGHKKHHLFGL